MIVGVIYGYMGGSDFSKLDVQSNGPQIVSLLAITLVVSAGLLARRPGVSVMLRSAFIWIALGLVLVTLYAFRADFEVVSNRVIAALVPGTVVENSQGEITINRDISGRFDINSEINNAPVTLVVDTGASYLTLTEADARAAGIDTRTLNFNVPVSTANGVGYIAPVRLQSLRIGSVQVPDVKAFVAQPDMLSTSLLGMSALNHFASWRVEGDTMILTPKAGYVQTRP
ncbi:retropepsin-like aspartic protease family protein [Flexibacterium corallicola]|uniref:retropepsin-like aspartic protease family protein n=1 Tax=Flexibacterium corallicola TaxID=3037259 RepID=UPI00286EFBBD|nr:TIGR02281 family clan AA aspartic protease [Pseudovibrio sp. M1P-2-3]